MKHTPGPWLCATKPENDHRVFYIYPDNGSNWIPALELATVYSGGNDNAKADAKLMTAAPELLEALKEVLAGSAHWKTVQEFGGYTLDDETKAKISAAINKAEGPRG